MKISTKKMITSAILSLAVSGMQAQCPVPSLVTASPATLCAGATTSLNATAVGAAINWYTVPVGGTPVGSSPSGANFPIVPATTTTYYAESYSTAISTTTYNYTGSLQNYTVPAGVSQITLSATGASGGSINVSCSAIGGRGTRMTGVFAVTPGQVLSILVGQQGLTNGSDAGGGGGSYVVEIPSNTPWLIAGGGGGASNNIGSCGANLAGVDAVITNNGTASGNNIVAGGVGGNGGGASSGSGGGGAGWLSNGVAGMGLPNNNGKSYLNGGAGGTGNNNDSGGYGGGGAGWFTGGNGGGGGGYSGGGTSGSQPFTGGGGAGSYNIGTSQVNTAGVGTGNGIVTITAPVVSCTSASRTAVTVTVEALPIISVNSGSICSGLSFTMVPSGANTYTFQGGNAIVSPTANASYTVVGTSTAGCVSNTYATSNVTVIANPTISVNSGSICSGASFTMVPSGANTYTFQGGNAIVSPTTNTSYTVVGTSTAGCISPAFATSNVTVITSPIVGITGNTLICGTGTNVLTANGANTYSWSTGDLTPATNVSPSVTTVYSVVGTSTISGCASTQTVSLLVSTNPSVTVTGSLTVCNGQTTNLTANGANTYSWSNGAVTASVALSPTATTVYSVVGTNTAGCTSTDIQTVTVNALPSLSVTGNNSICVGSSATLTASGADTYSWSTGATVAIVVVAPSATANYTTVGTSSTTGCSNTITVSLVVSPCTGLSDVTNAMSGLLVYPNPTNGEFIVELDSQSEKTIEVTDVTGRLVYSQKGIDAKLNVNINKLSNGIYYVKIQSNNAYEILKVVKQ